uniref:Endonuclease/exonuclease/phosphatase domain-containing protein n=1 Tax=Chenopodium quinoa TaxID=63459 RepID=A0A803LIP8_CHEQI
MEMEANTFLPPQFNPAEMLARFRLPFETDGPMKALRDAYLSMMPRVPLEIYDREGWNEAQGFSGGIWLFWRREHVSVTLYDENSQHMTILIKKNGDDPWLFSTIYVSLDNSLRRDLWRELERIHSNYSGPWLLGGDFNETMPIDERNGNNNSEMQRRRLEFSNWVKNNGLIDLDGTGTKHTWFLGLTLDTFKSERLGRGLANEEWRLLFEEGAVRNLPKIKSDHGPILINTNGFAPISMVNRPFKFQAAWMHHEKFEDFVHSTWDEATHIVPSLKEFAVKLECWNREEFHNIFCKKAKLWARLEGI